MPDHTPAPLGRFARFARFATPAVLAAAALSPLPAAAATVTYSTGFGLEWEVDTSVTGVYNLQEQFIQLRELPRFDASLGTLTGVSFGFTSDALARLNAGGVDNRVYDRDREVNFDGTLAMSLRLAVFDPGAVPSVLRQLQASGSCSDATTGYVTAVCNVEDEQAQGLNGGLNLSAVPLSSFVGTDPLNFFARMDVTLKGNCGDSIFDACYFDVMQGTLAAWAGIASVTYTYAAPGGGDPGGDTGGGGSGGGGGGGTTPNPVPEPGTVWMAGLALAGLVLTRRRPAAATA